MRALLGFILIAGLTAAACHRKPGSDGEYPEGAKIEAFSGHLTQDGKPVAFPADEEVTLYLTALEKGPRIGQSMGVPIQSDGTFSIGWMPVGKHAARLERQSIDPAKRIGPPRMYNIPGVLTIERGKTTDYLVELGASGNDKPAPYYSGPKVESFSGQLVHDGKPVTFPEDDEVIVRAAATEADGGTKIFGVPIKPDGTFKVGWMPAGKVALSLERQSKDPAKQKGGPRVYLVPGGLTIEAGKTSGYAIELGKDWQR